MRTRILGATSTSGIPALAVITLVVLMAVMMPLSLVRAQQDGEDELVGDYTVAFNSEEIPQDVANAEMIVGRWRVSFEQGGTYEAERLDLGVLIQGSYEVDGETVTITDESGLVSCANAAAATGGDADVSVATYTFDRGSNSLTLSPEDENCALRQVLLASKDFQFFVACNTPAEPVALAASPVPDEGLEADETPEADDPPLSRGTSPLDVISIDSTPDAEEIDEQDEDAESEASVADEIDDLLSQMTACWATGDPERFLPLWSQEFRDAFLSGTEDENRAALGSLQAAMQVPLTWVRAGDVDLIDDEHAEAVIRTTTLGEEEFVRYLFVFEDGEWRWDGAAG